eukprot:TRINITY_DN81690_c0_g1_i1.p1 TRINITY_DN81690_c0_g1~~TRINITY_DN81690_c0_g1_i1.p1  ORF type:complete len:268 (-),score=52.58 TRINITY_DN81690_c0_g1_i1:122-925(-)
MSDAIFHGLKQLIPRKCAERRRSLPVTLAALAAAILATFRGNSGSAFYPFAAAAWHSRLPGFCGSTLGSWICCSVSQDRRIETRVVAEPPTRFRPPDVEESVQAETSEWAECLVRFSDAATAADAQEVWVFRKRDYDEFQRLIGLRLSYRRPNPSKSPQDEAPIRFGEARREEAMESTKVTCRERKIDPDLVCSECVRVFTGGVYRDAGISVPAHPPAPAVLDCLALSVGETKTDADSSTNPQNQQWPLKQTAFCNYVNARFSTVTG